MKITIINGAPSERYSPFSQAFQNFKHQYTDSNEVTIFNLKDLSINYCTGCFNCWLKTPGICTLKDDMEMLLKENAKTDLILFTSPICAGTMTALTKKVLDRMIPVVLPYIKNFDGECHHPRRYDNRPDLGIVVMDNGNTDIESTSLLFNMFDRLAKNFHSEKIIKLSATAETMTEVLTNEISTY